MSPEVVLDPSDLAGLEVYARKRGFLAESESLRSAGKAGEGNMNLVLRLVTDARSIILKQSRPWVEKYPHIPAPADRALVETAFYETVAARPAVRDQMPELYASDPRARVLVLEDLGEARDFTTLYSGERLSDDDLDALVSYLVALHEPWGELPAIFANREMRALNHEHIFRLPLAPENGLDLDAFTPGLGKAASPLKSDPDYVARVTALGERYLEDGDVLVHGDYFPGSWLRTSDGVRIIDPEFCFTGIVAFDLGVLLAHLVLADQPVDRVERALTRYHPSDETAALAHQFAGVEIMRRLIGVAQLPLSLSLEDKRALLGRSRDLVLSS